MLIVKVKKFGVDWYISHEMAAQSATRGFMGYILILIGLNNISF